MSDCAVEQELLGWQTIGNVAQLIGFDRSQPHELAKAEPSAYK